MITDVFVNESDTCLTCYLSISIVGAVYDVYPHPTGDQTNSLDCSYLDGHITEVAAL